MNADSQRINNNNIFNSPIHEANSLNFQQKKLTCQICEINFESNQSLHIHLLVKHEFNNSSDSITDFSCPVCDLKFVRPIQLLVHIPNHGDSAKIYKCSDCSVGFVFKSQLLNHSYQHNPKPQHILNSSMASSSSINQGQITSQKKIMPTNLGSQIKEK